MSLFNILEKYKNKICVIDKANKYYYKDLLSLSAKITDVIPKRSLVLILCSNSFNYLAAYVGLLRKKCICILVDDTIDKHFLGKIINLYRPEYIFSSKNMGSCDTLKIINNTHIISKTIYLNKNNRIDKNLCLLLSTSGSTGSSKFVRISNENLKANTHSISKYLKISYADRLITTLNPSYTYGFSQINTHLINGASIILNNHSFFQKEFWDLFENLKPNNFGGVPFSYEMLKKIKFQDKDLSSLKYITQAGGKLNSELHHWIVDLCKKKNIRFYTMYGATEATSRMSYLDWKFSDKKIGSIGKPIPGGKMWIIDKKNKKIKDHHKNGRLVYQGKNVSMGYANKFSDLSKKDINKGFLVTGDIAYKDTQNFFYIVGREKRFIKIFGNRINLDEIEEKLLSEGISCACSGEDNLLTIYIENKKKIPLIKHYFSKKIVINQKYIKIICIKKLPRNSNGKIQYSKLFKDEYNEFT
jgi:long-chain acyl-CoA synthetase